MSYFLMLLFEYKRYKKDAMIRIYADDHLVDEVILEKEIKLKAVKYPEEGIYRERMGIPHKQEYPQNGYTPVQILPEKLFLFQISQQHLNRNIRIEVVNDNNNYTNGFMTQHSYIKFHMVDLFPVCLLESKNWSRLDRFLISKHMNKCWPWPHLPVEVNSEPNESSWCRNFYCYEKGGSFSVEFSLYKKHKIMHLGPIPAGKLWLIGDRARILCVFKALNMSA